MKKIILFFGFLSIIQNSFSQTDPNILIGLNNPSYGIKIKTNWPGGSGGWSRAFSLVNQNDTESFIKFGGYGDINNGVSSFVYGYVGRGYNDTFMVFKPNGNIGIGTTNPSYKLDVAGDIKSSTGLFRTGTGKFTFYDDTVAGTWAKIESKGLNIGDFNTDPNYGKIVTGDYDFTLNVKDYDRFFIEANNGNIGIGTTNPLAKLDIESGASDGTNSPILRLSSKDASVVSGQTLGELQFYNKDADGAHISSFIKAIATETYGRKGELSFGTTGVNSSNAIERMRIDENGNVGIGKTNPDMKLAVYSDDKFISRFHYEGSGLISGVRVGRNSSYGDLLSMSNGFGIGAGTSSGNLPINSESLTDIDFFINNGTGNIGIGTTSPNSKLEVNGEIAIGNGSNYSNLLFKPVSTISGYNGTFEILPKTIPGSGIATFLTHFKTNSVTGAGETRHDISFDGRVGVGTTNPGEKLEVLGNVRVRNSNGSNPVDAGSLEFMEAGTVWGTNGYGFRINQHGVNNTLRIQSNATTTVTDIMTFARSGKVGIGTSDPKNKLTVKGIINSEGDGGYYGAWFGGEKRTENPSINMGVWHNNKGSIYWDSNERRLVFSTQNNDTSVFDNTMSLEDGKVGIGVAAVPTDYKLAVAGKIITEEVKVKLQSSGWPDYVFTKEYDLLSIEEVETYIKKNGHLPKMPSAKEVEKEGILLGEMNKKLLEKIEELTLYTIDQKKEVKKQERKIKTLEEDNKQLKELLERVSKIEKLLKVK